MAKAKTISELDCQAPTGQMARLIAHVRLEELYDWVQYVDGPYNSKELHNMRIAAKRLRYTLEVFEDTLPKESKGIVQELTQLQDGLGLLHDSDVLIALLRLCLGSQESGASYQKALVRVQRQKKRKGFTLAPALVASVLSRTDSLSAEERYGLEQLLIAEQHTREERYLTFREHWSQLEARDFRQEVAHMLDQR